jgi:hypothetical protein
VGAYRHWLEPHDHSRRARGNPPCGSSAGCAPCWRRSESVRKKRPAILAALSDLLQDATAGDPIRGTKWTRKSLRRLVKALRRQKFKVSYETVDKS